MNDGPARPSAEAAVAHRPLTHARLTSGLLHHWQQRNLASSLPLALRQLEDAGNLGNLRLAIQAIQANQGGQGYRGQVFMDSDIYKTLEAIGWELAHANPSEHRPSEHRPSEHRPSEHRREEHPGLASFAARVTALLAQAQCPDGYPELLGPGER